MNSLTIEKPPTLRCLQILVAGGMAGQNSIISQQVDGTRHDFDMLGRSKDKTQSQLQLGPTPLRSPVTSNEGLRGWIAGRPAQPTDVTIEM
jgi:hypothetical protein